ncbi:MAG: sugar transferase [Rhizobiales bacterium]|nr:sugar transferase [Hyphomicrobiales bacterium]
MKRVFDVVGAGLLLLVLLPLLLCVALAIRLDSSGPVLFSQRRHGLNGKIIRVWKFRTMHHQDSDYAGTVQAVAGDHRITRLGRVLRRSNIDELPQLWNVIRGDMSLVGPRPHPLGMQAGSMDYEDLVAAYHVRHLVRPGITGLSQSRGYRGPTKRPLDARLRVVGDLAYITRFNILFDLRILVETVVSEIRRGGGA